MAQHYCAGSFLFENSYTGLYIFVGVFMWRRSCGEYRMLCHEFERRLNSNSLKNAEKSNAFCCYLFRFCQPPKRSSEVCITSDSLTGQMHQSVGLLLKLSEYTRKFNLLDFCCCCVRMAVIFSLVERT